MFLNKIDILQHKLKHGPNRVASYFPAYTGPAQDFAAVAEFFRQQFVARAMAKKGAVFTHLTSATDTRMLETVLSAVLHTVVQQRLAGRGCLLVCCISLALVLAGSCCLWFSECFFFFTLLDLRHLIVVSPRFRV